MGYQTISLGLTLVIPTSGTRNWGNQLTSGTWNKISQHDHSGGGNGNALGTTAILDDAITSAKIGPNIALTQATVTIAGLNQTQAIDWNNGNIQVVDMTGASGTVTLTFSNAQAGASYRLFVIRPAGALPVTWPAAVKWPQGEAPVWSETLNAVDSVTLYYTGSVYYSEWELSYS